jgi:NAD/NADP transhydrogenase beta subunit
MSLFAFTNLYRLTKGTDFEMNPVNPDDAILSNRGRPFVAQMGKQACSSSFFEISSSSFIGENSTSAAQEQEQEQSDDADAKNFTEEMKQMRNQFNTPEYVIDYGEQTPI